MNEKNLNMMEEEIVAKEEAVKEEDMTDIENDVYEFDCNEEKPKSIVDKIKEFGAKAVEFVIDHPVLTQCVAVGSGVLIAYGIGRAFGKAEAMDALAEIARQGAEIDSEK